MKERILSRNIAHNKFRKKIRRLYNRGHITKENYEYLLFQRTLYEDCGESIETWKYLNHEVFDRFNEINQDNVITVIEEWVY